jgi:uncharacterized membrane protein YcaP (DUF421 family)
MNNFDWIVTVAIGSLMASGIVVANVTVMESLLAIAMLLALQYLVTTFIPKSSMLKALVKAEPRVLIRDGVYLEDAMRDERVTKDEIEAALREEGLTSACQARWVILETDATFSVIPSSAEIPSAAAESILPKKSIDKPLLGPRFN